MKLKFANAKLEALKIAKNSTIGGELNITSSDTGFSIVAGKIFVCEPVTHIKCFDVEDSPLDTPRWQFAHKSPSAVHPKNAQ